MSSYPPSPTFERGAHKVVIEKGPANELPADRVWRAVIWHGTEWEVLFAATQEEVMRLAVEWCDARPSAGAFL